MIPLVALPSSPLTSHAGGGEDSVSKEGAPKLFSAQQSEALIHLSADLDAASEAASDTPLGKLTPKLGARAVGSFSCHGAEPGENGQVTNLTLPFAYLSLPDLTLP